MYGLHPQRVARLLGAALLLPAGLGALSACDTRAPAASGPKGRRLLVLGIDGMDPALLRELMDAGRMPNFKRVAEAGSFKELATSMPPQSPVAWSNFISGAGPGTHQIYDFIHRDPNPATPGLAILPYLSTSRTTPPADDRALTLGRWRIPLSSPTSEQLRRGETFWDHLAARGVETVIYRVPANYPPPPLEGPAYCACLSGMGTPDVLGTWGEFTCFTPDAPLEGRRVGGGRFVYLNVVNHRATAILAGPDNFLRKADPNSSTPTMEVRLELVRDPRAAVVKIVVANQTLLLNEGEWSDWIRVEFQTGIPASALLDAVGVPSGIRAMIRILAKQVHPKLELYVSPLNIDPRAPATPISTPAGFSKELARACGPYYTTGIPEDSKALRRGALNEDEYLAQVRLLVAERRRQYRYALRRFDRGLLFFYFGHTDQVAHMFWRDRDPQHPGRVAEQAARYANVITDTYIEMDELVGETLELLDDDDTLIILSDHGFTTFRRGFNLNTWLLRNGYLSVFGTLGPGRSLGLADIDWSRTRAYGLGLNSLYVNLRGREKQGLVEPGPQRTALLAELAEKLRAVRDANGERVIERTYLVDEYYPGADPAVAPDLLIGYARTYRASWATALGGFSAGLIEDNLDRWSGTHLIAHYLVPGILVTNRKVTIDHPALTDVAPTILSVFGIDKPPGMSGRPLWAAGSAPPPPFNARTSENNHALAENQD